MKRKMSKVSIYLAVIGLITVIFFYATSDVGVYSSKKWTELTPCDIKSITLEPNANWLTDKQTIKNNIELPKIYNSEIFNLMRGEYDSHQFEKGLFTKPSRTRRLTVKFKTSKGIFYFDVSLSRNNDIAYYEEIDEFYDNGAVKTIYGGNTTGSDKLATLIIKLVKDNWKDEQKNTMDGSTVEVKEPKPKND